MAEPWYAGLVRRAPFLSGLAGRGQDPHSYGQTGVSMGGDSGDPYAKMSMEAPAGSGPMSSSLEMQSARPSGAAPTTNHGPAFNDYVHTALQLYRIYQGEDGITEARKQAETQAHADGLSTNIPAPPPSSSKERQAGRAVGSLAANFIPVVGPYVSAGLNMASSEIDRKNADDYMRSLSNLSNRSDVAQQAGLEKLPGEDPTDALQHTLRTIDQGAAGYFGGPGGSFLAGLASGKQDAKDQKRAAKKTAAVEAENAKKLEEYRARFAQASRVAAPPAPMRTLAINPGAIY